MRKDNIIEYTLTDIVLKMVGGGITPVGETNYDKQALERMYVLEDLALELINRIGTVAIQKGQEASVNKASWEAMMILTGLQNATEGFLWEASLEDVTDEDEDEDEEG